MTRRYSAFIVRCWHLASGEQRYAVEDIQIGAAVRVPSLNEAFDWVATQSSEASGQEAAQPMALGWASSIRQGDHKSEA